MKTFRISCLIIALTALMLLLLQWLGINIIVDGDHWKDKINKTVITYAFLVITVGYSFLFFNLKKNKKG